MPPLILIIEDEKILADSMSLYLRRHGYATAVAYAGEDGVRLAEESNPAVAVVDIRLPGIDGLEVLTRVRERSPQTEVVMTTAHAPASAALEAKKRGAFGYLNKPVDLDALRIVVERALARSRRSPEEGDRATG
jgi:DNA-binding NtrC family response regulator